MAVEVLIPIHARSGGSGPCMMNPEGFAVEPCVALMIVQIGELRGRAERLFAVPIADIVSVSAGEDNQPGAERVRAMRN